MYAGTFRCTPGGFKQILVYLVVDKGSGLHVPVFSCLMTCQDGKCYDAVFLKIISCVGKKLGSIKFAMLDFEKAIINSVDKWFGVRYHIMVVFHWKQAIRKNLIDLLDCDREESVCCRGLNG